MVALNKPYCVSVKADTFTILVRYIEMYLQQKEKLKLFAQEGSETWYIFHKFIIQECG